MANTLRTSGRPGSSSRTSAEDSGPANSITASQWPAMKATSGGAGRQLTGTMTAPSLPAPSSSSK